MSGAPEAPQGVLTAGHRLDVVEEAIVELAAAVGARTEHVYVTVAETDSCRQV